MDKIIKGHEGLTLERGMSGSSVAFLDTNLLEIKGYILVV